MLVYTLIGLRPHPLRSVAELRSRVMKIAGANVPPAMRLELNKLADARSTMTIEECMNIDDYAYVTDEEFDQFCVMARKLAKPTRHA